jgi:hypothetical protein
VKLTRSRVCEEVLGDDEIASDIANLPFNAEPT